MLSQRKKDLAELEAKAETSRQRTEGRPGKGTAQDYEVFCLRCHLEYLEAVPECFRCKSTQLTPRLERQQQLCDKVNSLLRAKERRKERRARFKQVQSQREEQNRSEVAGQSDKELSAGTDYGTWDNWEPSSSEEEFQRPEGAEFEAMEKDMIERAERRRKKARAAEAEKTLGNAAFKAKDYHGAIAYYSKGLEHRKDLKSLYTNRAAAHLQLSQWKEAVADCDTALDIFELLEDGKIRGAEKGVVLKAYSRRAGAKRELGELEGAQQDLKSALALVPGHAECTALLAQLDKDVEEAAQAKRVQDMMRPRDIRELAAKVTGAKSVEETASLVQDAVQAQDVATTASLVQQLKDKRSLQAKQWAVLARRLEDSDGARVAFREAGGLAAAVAVLHTHASGEAGAKKANSTQIGLCLATLSHAFENEHNGEAFLKRLDGAVCLWELLKAPYSKDITARALAVLHVLSEVASHRSLLLKSDDTRSGLGACLLRCVSFADPEASEKESSMVQRKAVGVLGNCALQANFRHWLRQCDPSVFAHIRVLAATATAPDIRTSAIGALLNILADRQLRAAFADSEREVKFVGGLLSEALAHAAAAGVCVCFPLLVEFYSNVEI